MSVEAAKNATKNTAGNARGEAICDTIIVMCSPNVNLLTARRAVNSIKSTDLSRAELYVIDNNYDDSFSHPVVMNDCLRLAASLGKNAIFLDDDVEIYDYGWIARLYEASDKLGADIVGCTHVFEDGEINHQGYCVDEWGVSEPITDFMHKPETIAGGAVYVPTLCSAVMLVKNCGDYVFDTSFRKYQQDLDICIQAWSRGKKVACVLSLEAIHHQGYTAASNPGFSSIYYEDCARLAVKWGDYLKEFQRIADLEQYASFNSKMGWSQFYNKATRMKYIDQNRALPMFRQIAAHCFNRRLRAGSYFHLYQIEKERSHLENCLRANPCHKMAAEYLKELSPHDAAFLSNCGLSYNCRKCVLKKR
ncbi:MAG: hypothetical protein HQK89_12250 [Nitrospirae bacterium]|nr:hypothetical protein [Nitrospirota bacterium]